MRLSDINVTALAALALLTGWTAASAADSYGLKPGKLELKIAGPLAFGPPGILFVGDPQDATIYAVDTGDKKGDAASVSIQVAGLNEKLAEALGASAADIQINDMAVNPSSGAIYLSLSNGKTAALAKVDPAGKVAALPLGSIAHSKTQLPNPPADELVGQGRRQRNLRTESITDLQYVDGRVLVSGLADGDNSSVRGLNFPFSDSAAAGASLEIFHAAHGRSETNAVIRTFVPFNIGGKPNLLAGFTCTPLVRFPLQTLSDGKRVRGTTIAELGNRNKPLDMIVYEQGGQQYLLMANTARGVMKISTADIEQQKGLTDPVRGGGTAGQSFETIESWKGVVQLDKLNDTHAALIVQNEGSFDLKTVALP